MKQEGNETKSSKISNYKSNGPITKDQITAVQLTEEKLAKKKQYTGNLLRRKA